MKRITERFLGAAARRIPSSLVSPSPASTGIRVELMVNVGPPALPWYPQPACPGSGHIWVPGYWGYGSHGYYWIPGAWVFPPVAGLLWTPGYWAWERGYYRWRPGYWARHVGFYGGIDYGHGYSGRGYHGGYWHDSHFYYNVAVNNVDGDRVRFVYAKPLPSRRNTSRVSYNGGRGGVDARPTARERAWSRERRFGLTAVQKQRCERARTNPAMRYEENHDRLFAVGRGEHSVQRPAIRRPGSERQDGRGGFRQLQSETPAHRPGMRHPRPGEKRTGKPPVEQTRLPA